MCHANDNPAPSCAATCEPYPLLLRIHSGGKRFGPSGAALNLAADGRVRQDLTVKAPQVGLANVVFSARTNGGSDALKLPIPVKARGYEETKTLVGSARQPTVTFTLPAGTNPATVKLNVSATPSLLSAVTPALEFLLGYPYGCTEQTMSRFLPALLARQALGAGTLPDDVTASQLNEYTELGLARLAKFQHQDGGWNFWEYDDSTLEMTAYVTEGLLRAKAVGARVDNAMLDRALKYLSRTVKSSKERQADRARAYRALAQAGRVNTPELLAFSRRADLVPYSLANTAMALKSAGQAQAAKATLERLKARRLSGNGLVHWKGSSNDTWISYWDDNSNQVTAAALEALALLEPQSKLIPGASQWLLTQRRGPQWLSTQDTASVIVAALSLPRGQAGAPQALPVQVDGQKLGQLEVKGRSASLERSVPLGAGRHTVTLPGAATGTIFSAEVKYAREPANLGGINNGIAVTRQYEKLTARWDAKNERYTYSRTPLMQNGTLKDVKVGDLVLVTLTIDPKQDFSRYLLVSDPIPAGTKAMDERSLVIAGLVWLAALLAVALDSRMLAFAGVAVGAVVVAAGLSRLLVALPGGQVRPEVTPWLLIAFAALVAGAAETIDRARVSLARVSFGAGQALVVGVTVLALAGVLAATAWWVAGGAGRPLHRGADNVLPSFVQDSMTGPGRTRTLVVDMGDGQPRWLLSQTDGTTWGDAEWALGPTDPRARDEAVAAVAQIAAARQNDVLADRLAALGVAHVQLRGSTNEVSSALAATPGMTRGGEENGVTVFSVAGRPTRTQVETRDGVVMVAGSITAPTTGTLRLSEADDPRWQVTVGGKELPRAASSDWRPAFTLAGETGPVTATLRPDAARPWVALLQLLGLLAMALLAAPSVRRASDAQLGRRSWVEEAAA